VVELAALLGGTPGYVMRCDPGMSLERNLLLRVLTRGEPLYEEVPFLLREELREPRVYMAVLSAIAGGARKFGEISSKVGLDRSNLSRYLATLAELGLVEREVPITEPRPDKSRRGLYRLSDPFLATWFAFVLPHRTLLERGRVEEVMTRRVRPRLASHLGRAVEPVLADLLSTGPWAEQVPFEVAASGRHWSPSAEFDVVLLDERRVRAFVAEIKWTRRKVSPVGLDRLRARVREDSAFADMEVTFALISRAGFTSRRASALDERLLDVSRMSLHHRR
jgi:AAA+ ATPase superfamily predicted ATPase